MRLFRRQPHARRTVPSGLVLVTRHGPRECGRRPDLGWGADCRSALHPELLKDLGQDPDNANVATPVPHVKDDLDELIIDIAVLIAEELDLTHRLGGHHRPVEGCARCERGRCVPGSFLETRKA